MNLYHKCKPQHTKKGLTGQNGETFLGAKSPLGVSRLRNNVTLDENNSADEVSIPSRGKQGAQLKAFGSLLAWDA